MTLRRLIILVGLVAAMALFLIYEHSRIMRAGYQVSRLTRDEARLIDAIRIQNVQLTRLRRPEFIARQVERMRIDLMRQPDAAFMPVSTASADMSD